MQPGNRCARRNRREISNVARRNQPIEWGGQLRAVQRTFGVSDGNLSKLYLGLSIIDTHLAHSTALQGLKPRQGAICLVFLNAGLIQGNLERFKVKHGNRCTLCDGLALNDRDINNLATHLKRKINGFFCNRMAKELTRGFGGAGLNLNQLHQFWLILRDGESAAKCNK